MEKNSNSGLNKPIYMYLTINEHIEPLDRGDCYEDPLDEALVEKKYGETTGGGTMQTGSEFLGKEEKMIEYAGIDVELTDIEHGIPFVIETLEIIGAPRGSKLQYILDDKEIEIFFGTHEGIAAYFSPMTSDDDWDYMKKILERHPDIRIYARYWEGSGTEMFALYGPSKNVLQEVIDDFSKTRLLEDKIRIEQLTP
ncbi:MAG: hypothetical protein ACFFAS_16120 [Promethearchaeota archaeon]